MEETTNAGAVESECLRRLDQLRWDQQDVHRALRDLADLVKETHTIAREIQMEQDELIRKGVIS